MEKCFWTARKYLSFINSKFINSNFRDKYQFIDRSNDRDSLVVILAGKKRLLWKCVFPRFYDYLDNVDVVIANAGDLHPEEIREISKEYGFSYLVTKSRRLSSAVNLAIRQHGNAKWIYKLDDDVFIDKNFLTNLKETYKRIKEEEIYEPGMVVPLLNINNFTYYHFLKTLDLIDEYSKKFGKIKLNGINSELYRNGNAAVYIWRKSLPLGSTSEIFKEKNKKKIDVCPCRFSISAILFKRALWERMGGFLSSAPGMLGTDEESINSNVLVNEPVSQTIVCLDTLVGHFGYFTHMKEMTDFFRKNEKSFMER